MATAYEKLVAFLTKQGVRYREVQHAAEGACDKVSAIRGNHISQAMKAIVLRAAVTKKEGKYFLAVVPGDAQLDMEAIKGHARAIDIRFAPADRAKEYTGCEMGAVPPFLPLNEAGEFDATNLTLLVDPSVGQNAEIVFNACCLDRSIFMSCEDYLRLAGAKMLPMVKKSEAGAGLFDRSSVGAVANAASAKPSSPR